MKRILILAAAALFVTVGVSAQESYTYSPKAGDFSIGVTFNPASLANSNYQPDAGAFSGDYVKGLANYPKQMFILSMDPVASFQIKYRLMEHWSVRANLGISGSKVDYKEYVQNDAKATMSGGEYAKVEDAVHSSLNGMSLGLAAEYTKAFGKLAFVSGIGLQFALGGGAMTFDYGNSYSSSNTNPTSMAMTKLKAAGSLNEYDGFDSDVTYARPLERYNIGYNKGIGLTFDMGLEYFFAGSMSISGAMTFTPFMLVFQPQTYTRYEGWDSGSVKEMNWTVSPGSKAMLYGTENIGFRISFNYYM